MSEAQAVYRVGNDAETTTPKFAENHVKAVAEFLWWKGAQKRTLLTEFNLTEEQFKEIQPTPEYKARVFKRMLENRSAEEFEAWVESYHDKPLRLGAIVGLPPEVVRDLVAQVRQAHADKAVSQVYFKEPCFAEAAGMENTILL